MTLRPSIQARSGAHRPIGSRARRVAGAIGAGSAILLAALACAPQPALASHNQVAILQDDVNLFGNPGPTLQEMRHVGVQMVRVLVRWSTIAPAAGSRTEPNFNATDPSAYPAANWAPYDTIVRTATADGLKLMFVPTGFAPLWAQGPNPQRFGARYDPNFAFEPSAAKYGQFVRALSTRYSGGFRPPGALSALPRVSTWELWNEPDFGEDLAPQAVDGSRVLYSPRMYRSLAGAGWSALHATGHGRDTILIGATAARGAFSTRRTTKHPQGLPGTLGETKPLVFLRELYCLDGRFRRYLGAAARVRGCPATNAAYRRFRARNPVLFGASGVSDHPYPLNGPPNKSDSKDPSYAEFSELPRMASELDRIQRVYGSHKRFAIWNTEYGYVTCPPTCIHTPQYASAANAAYYMNWAEYLSWRNPRIASTMQYLLYDPNPSVGQPEFGGFASGLIYYPTVMGGQAKPAYYSYRLPIYMPHTSARPGRALEVWGDVRAAPYAGQDTRQPQYAQIQFAPGSGNSWTAVKTVQVTNPEGYIDTSVVLPGSGSVRIAWTYPPTDLALASTLVTGYTEPLGPVVSRSVQVQIG